MSSEEAMMKVWADSCGISDVNDDRLTHGWPEEFISFKQGWNESEKRFEKIAEQFEWEAKSLRETYPDSERTMVGAIVYADMAALIRRQLALRKEESK